MASPDVRSYVDLTVFDDNPVEVLNDILSAGRALLPNWTPAVGQIEAVLAEAIALRSSEVVAAINRVPSATTEVLLQLFGLTRSDGVASTALINLTFSNAGQLPAGTEFLYVNSATSTSYIFSLDAALDMTASDYDAGSGTYIKSNVAVTAQEVGTKYNFSADGLGLTLLSNASFFLSATFATSPSGGANAESDQAYFDRGVALLGSYTSASTTASQIKYYVASNKTYANRVEVYNRRRYRDRDTTADDYGVHDGAVLVAVAAAVNNAASATSEITVSASNLADLYSSLDARTPAGTFIDVMSAELVDVDITATVVKKSGFSSSTVSASITSALQSYLNTNTWDWSTQRIRRNEVISLIDSVAGVDYVDALTMNGSSLIGTSNVGYYATSNGSKATGTFTISGATPGTYTAGEAAFYWVDSTTDPDNPNVYTFVNTGTFVVDGSGNASGVSYEAVANGVAYNDTDNSGVVSASATFIGSAGDSGGTATVSDALSGGSNNYLSFTALDGTGDGVQTDIVIRNLGTLVTYGEISLAIN
jgi:hypothetical protein